MKNINLDGLKEFLFEANAHGYGGESKEVKPQRPGFDELEYKKGDWYFRDSYAGHYYAPGQEIVYFQDEPVWAMAYSGGMMPSYHGDVEMTRMTITFLKKALMAMEKNLPFRGPKLLEEGDWRYESKVNGDVSDFSGVERIYFKNEVVFKQNFIGGLIID